MPSPRFATPRITALTTEGCRLHTQTSRHPRLLATVLVVLSGLCGDPTTLHAQPCNSDDATAPCFAQNQDILGGQRYLLRNDDLVANLPFVANNQTEVGNYLLKTASGAVSNQTTDHVVTANCFISPPVTPPSQTRVGRVFSLPNDVAVTLAPMAAATGSTYSNGSSANLGLYVHDPQDSSNNSVSTLFNSAAWVQLVLGDFNKDGFEDVFVIDEQVVAAILTAANLDKPSDGLGLQNADTMSAAYAPQGAPVVGDLNGDGILDVAWPGANPVTGAEFGGGGAVVCARQPDRGTQSTLRFHECPLGAEWEGASCS